VLSNSSPLSFALELRGGQTIASVGDAAAYFSALTGEQREAGHWKIAIQMLNTAIREPSYLRAASMSLQTALLLDDALLSAHSLEQL
jgi:hypothetical protein